MALSDEAKRKSMDAVIERERAAFKGRLRSPAPAPVRGGVFDAAKGVASGVKTVTQVGWPKVVVGAAIYAAHIRQMDRGRYRPRGRLPQRGQKIKGMERDYA